MTLNKIAVITNPIHPSMRESFYTIETLSSVRLYEWSNERNYNQSCTYKLPLTLDAIIQALSSVDGVIILSTPTFHHEWKQGEDQTITRMYQAVINHCFKKAGVHICFFPSQNDEYEKKTLHHTSEGDRLQSQMETVLETCEFFFKNVRNDKIKSAKKRRVTSVQQFSTQSKHPAIYWRQTYFNWIERWTKGAIHVDETKHNIHFLLRGTGTPLISFNEDLYSDENIDSLFITSGALNHEKTNANPLARMYFLTNHDEKQLYIGLIHFQPHLYWPIYRYTQGILHAFVMNRFGAYIKQM
ncbi:hypothetical protein [Texcoconibacillus texcoconensis]|uniref:Uncharacterized protein n=1 Tax=Texcoconibacillus texcoconensis TaxID=1095777 RepID=A0A840QT80_9BACI|nr:hypothetical protein [Texcoconibacillus texcoconensis]MBB5174491.1 hypothetical protein [Texcoconibacillus texcoconensis]